MDSHLHGRTGWFKISSFNVSRTAGSRSWHGMVEGEREMESGRDFIHVLWGDQTHRAIGGQGCEDELFQQQREAQLLQGVAEALPGRCMHAQRHFQGIQSLPQRLQQPAVHTSQALEVSRVVGGGAGVGGWV